MHVTHSLRKSEAVEFALAGPVEDAEVNAFPMARESGDIEAAMTRTCAEGEGRPRIHGKG